jgi:hypothetical protein
MFTALPPFLFRFSSIGESQQRPSHFDYVAAARFGLRDAPTDQITFRTIGVSQNAAIQAEKIVGATGQLRSTSDKIARSNATPESIASTSNGSSTRSFM